MRESQLEKEIEHAEEVYEGLLQTRRSLGTQLAQAIRRGADLDEFGRHLQELPLLIRQADLRRTELRHELSDRRARRVEEEYRRSAEEVSKAAQALEQARKAYIKAEERAKRLGLEARRLAEVRDTEANHLQGLLRLAEDAQLYQGENQQGEQEEVQPGSRAAQERYQQGEERANNPSQDSGDMQAVSGAIIPGEDANRGSAR